MPTALIVEDEPEANELLSMLVRLRGYQTESAFSGEEALDKADRRQPDILFLDLMLPDITGYDVCTSLKARRATNGIPIVMVTARLAEENRRKGFRAGANEYIPKPYTPDQIFKAMQMADTWRRQMDQIATEGTFGIELSADMAPFQHVSEIRSLLLSRSSTAEENVAAFGQSLAEIIQRGLDWGRKRKATRVASVNYRLDPNQFLLDLHDESGWFEEDHPDEDGLARLIQQGQFDQVDFDAAKARLVLTTRLD